MDIDNLKLELPSNLADICRFSFDYSNLMKIIDYLFNNNLVMIKEIKGLRTRVYDLELIQDEFEKIKSKMNLIEKSNDNVNRNFLDIKERFIKNDSKITDLIKKDEKSWEDLEKYIKIVDGHDTNINNLNKVVEENVKTIKQNQENLGLNYERLKKVEENVKEINLENIKIHELIEKTNIKNNEDHSFDIKNIESINNNIGEINESINSIKIIMDKKNRDFDTCINNIMDNIAELSSKGIKTENKEAEINDNNLFKIAMGEIERTNEKINTYNEEQKASINKKEKDIETVKKAIEIIKSDITGINNKIININPHKEEENKIIKPETENKFATINSVEKLDEKIKTLMKSINSLPNREEYGAFHRETLLRLKKLEDSNLGILALETKFNNNIKETNKEQKETNLNYFNSIFADKLRASLFNDLNNSFKEMIKKEGKNLDLSKNPQISEIIKIITRHNEDINNNNKSVIDLRKIIIAIDIDKKMSFLMEKINNLEEEDERNKKKLLNLNNLINGNEEKENENENEENFEPTCLRGKIEITEKLFNVMNEKITSIESKYKSITKEIKDDIKSNLKVESIKTVNQFREKLELFTRRFEEELRNKIDQMGLNNFEKRMNTKIYFDLKDKLNRQEMQKNTNLINRKIDSLENKISKTLVDTIIDLQMDEAPLIMKKAPNNIEICASCNQIIPKDIQNKSSNSTEIISQSNINNINNKSLNINKFMSNSTSNKFRKTFYGYNKTQTIMPKLNHVMSLKKELPDINKNNN